MLIRRLTCVMALGVTALVAAPSRGDDVKKIELGDVPAKVRQAADHAAPGVKWAHASMETEKGKTFYELTGKNARDRRVEVEVTLDGGEVLEIETELPLSEVPVTVTEAFKTKYPQLEATGAEAVTHDSQIDSYDILTKKGRKVVEYRVSADGKTVKFEEEEAEEDN